MPDPEDRSGGFRTRNGPVRFVVLEEKFPDGAPSLATQAEQTSTRRRKKVSIELAFSGKFWRNVDHNVVMKYEKLKPKANIML